VEGGTPIVPVKLRVNRISIIDKRRLPSAFRGDVEFVVGKPLIFDVDTDAAVATIRLQEAVAAL
jgi:hypothetical protein